MKAPGLRLGAILLLALSFGAPSVGAAEPRVLVISGSGEEAVEQTLAGLRQSLAGLAVTTSFRTLSKDMVHGELQSAPADTVFVALGAAAVNEVLLQQSKPALVSCLGPNDERLAKLDQAVGVPGEVAPEQRAAWLRRLLPKARRIALLHDPENSDARIPALAEALSRAGLQVLADEVHRPSELPPALERLAARADVIFGVEDRTVFMPQTAKALLLFSFRNRIPLVGTSSAWTKAGALYALEPDYTDLGRRCGQAVARMLGQTKTGVTGAPRLLLSLNLRTARHMNINWGNDIIQLASTVYE